MKKPNPALMSLRDLESAIDRQMATQPNGSPYADMLIDEFESRHDRESGASMSASELDEAIAAELASHPSGSPRGTELLDVHERRQGTTIDVAETY